MEVLDRGLHEVEDSPEVAAIKAGVTPGEKETLSLLSNSLWRVCGEFVSHFQGYIWGKYYRPFR